MPINILKNIKKNNLLEKKIQFKKNFENLSKRYIKKSIDLYHKLKEVKEICFINKGIEKIPAKNIQRLIDDLIIQKKRKANLRNLV